MINYLFALNHLCPGAQLSCEGDFDNYDNFVWHDHRSMPSKAECDAVMAEVMADRANKSQQARRFGALQAEADPIFFAWQRGEATEQDWLDKVAEIRARYPYS